uniref:CSON015284 protein n=1 Tax=Culicoides sonorensis TaxID=179676 RepID=A0A336MH64_CULSO
MASTSKQKPKREFPLDLIDEYTNNCEKLTKYENAVIKRFAPNLVEILNEFIRLSYVFNESMLPEYAALCYQSAARCEFLQNRFVFERDFLLKAADAFMKAYNERIDFGYSSGEREYKIGALQCYNEILTSPHLPQDSFIRASVIRLLKEIDPESPQTSTFHSPIMRYEDLKRGATYDMQKGNYWGALNKLTDIHDDIIERKKADYHAAVLEFAEITRLLLLLHLEFPPAALAPSNAALLDRYKLDEELDVSKRAAESALEPELHLMFRAFYQGIQLRHVEFLRDAFDDLGRVPFFTAEQHKLLRLVFYKHLEELRIEEACKPCQCYKMIESESSSDDDDEESGEEEGAVGGQKEKREKSPKAKRKHKLDICKGAFTVISEDEEEIPGTSKDESENEEMPTTVSDTSENLPEKNKIEENKDQEGILVEKIESLEIQKDTKDWVDPLTQALEEEKEEDL